MKNRKIGFVVVLIALLIAGITGFSHVKADNIASTGKIYVARTLNVNGTGIIKAVPDIARITLGFVNEEKDAKSSQENNARVSNEIIKILKSMGIEEKDIQTSDFSISPVYTYEPNKDPVVRGYQTVNMLTVTVRKIGDIGLVIDSTAKAGANRFQNIVFDVNDKDTLKLKAIEEAVKDARKKAEAGLAPEGEHVIQLISMSIDGGWSQPAPVYRNDLKEGAPSAPSIQPGELSLTITVQVSYSF